jgi:hypothetical protein
MRAAAALIFGVTIYALAWTTAAGAQPWWHLSTGVRPTKLMTTAADESQEIAVEDNSVVAAKLQDQEGHPLACLTSKLIIEAGFAEVLCEGYTAAQIDDDAAQLQATLESVYGGGGAVQVTGKEGGPGDVGDVEEGGGEPIIVTWPKRFVPRLTVAESSIGSTAVNVLSEGGIGKMVIEAINLGTTRIEGATSPVTIKDNLPAGLVAEGLAGAGGPGGKGETGFPEEGIAPDLTCSANTDSCVYTGELKPYQHVEIVVWVNKAGVLAHDAQNEVTVSGGGATAVSEHEPVEVGEQVVFGVEKYEFEPEQEGGMPATQAGGHPYQLTTTLRLNESGSVPFQPAEPRNLTVELPRGLVANVAATAQCEDAVFEHFTENGTNNCPSDAAIGVSTATVVQYHPPDTTQFSPIAPVFNLTPAPGEPARFGFVVARVPVILNTYLRAGGGYAATVSVKNLTQLGGLVSSMVTVWGVPGEASHDDVRGWECFNVRGGEEQPGCAPPLSSTKPLLTMPSSCEETLQSQVTVQSWLSSALPTSPFESGYSGGLDGCNQEGFEPSLKLQTSTKTAFTPTELDVHLKVPQAASELASGVAEADVRNTTVTLPAGLQLNPSAAGGLVGCAEKQIGYRELRGAEPVFEEESEAERDGEASHKYGCPEAAALGTVRVKTPLLEEGHEELTGYVYQAAQDANPFGSLLALYIVAEAPKSGVRVRLAGKVEVGVDGQLVSTFPETPQLPFEEFELRFFGGGKAPLATSGCGLYMTTSSIESWAGGPAAAPSSLFTVSSGPAGKSCSGVGGFAPGFVAGTTNNAAKAFSPFTATFTRNDEEQTFGKASITMPPGLAAILADVPLCPEAAANAGTCSEASKIGHVQVSAGIGNEPVVLPEAGKPQDPVYLTGPYKGAPFGLSVVAPAEAGPFNLGTVVVRAQILVNPHTAQVSAVSDPLPTRLQGIPLDVRSITVDVDRSKFVFNPTNCSAMSVSGVIGSSENANAPVSNRFQAADCANLSFKPGFEVTTHKGHTKRFGAFLHVKVTSSSSQANIRSVFVELPKLLPSRVATLNHACSEAQFAQNPAGCPADSHVGTAIVHTPVLPVPLTGSAIFVSHGGAKFPDLDIVLQGDNVTVDLTGNTNIEKDVTSSDFKSTPDVPISSFELTLPTGSHSALAATGNLCFKTVARRVKVKAHGVTVYRKRFVKQKRALIMPTTITGQNGAVVKQATKIAVQGCGKARR